MDTKKLLKRIYIHRFNRRYDTCRSLEEGKKVDWNRGLDRFQKNQAIIQ